MQTQTGSDLRVTFSGDSSALKSELTTAGNAVKDFGEKAEKYMQKGELSAKQMAFATRSLPAQFTDIAVSLQAGQSPLTVFLQQGGQIKDMFGGIGPAAVAMGGYIAELVNPISLTVAAIGTLAVAYHQGAAEAQAYSRAILLSGNASGTTANELANMAKAVSAATGATLHESAAAMASFAADGSMTSSQFQKLGAAAVTWQKATGTAVADTVKQFNELGKEPLTASLKINESTNYLTVSVYDQIKALTEQGRMLEAGTLAQNTWADAINNRAPQLLENLSFIERAWKGIAGAAKGGWSAMLGIGQTVDPTTKIKERMAAIRQAQGDIYGNSPFLQGQLDDLQKQLEYWDHINASRHDMAASQEKNAKALRDQESFDKLHDQYLSKAVHMQREIAQAVEKFSTVEQTPENLAAYIATVQGIQDKFKESPVKKPRLDEGEKFIQQLQRKIAGEQQDEFAMLRTEAAQKKVSEGAEKFIAILESDEKQRRRTKLLTQEILRDLKLEEDQRAGMADFVTQGNAITRGIQQQTEMLGLNANEQQRLNHMRQIDLALSQALLKTKPEEIANLLRVSEVMKGNVSQALQDNIDKQKELNASIQYGARTALESYADDASKVSTKVGAAVTQSFKGMEDAIVTFAHTGELSFSSLANSIISDMMRISLQQSVTGPLASMLGQLGSGISLEGAFKNATGDFTAFAANPGTSGARASGGPVSAGGLYKVNENGPEILNVGGDQFLMMGNQSGSVTPNSAIKSAVQPINITINATVGNVASQSDVVQGMQIVRQQIISQLSRNNSYGGVNS